MQLDNRLELRRKLKERVKGFDLCALVNVLREVGYDADDVYFVSSDSWVSGGSLCERIDFFDGSVQVVLNMGFLTGNSPLPMFFRKKMDDGVIDARGFKRFLAFFDHHVIEQFLAASVPEWGGHGLKWQKMKRDYLCLARIDCQVTMAHLFQLCFPELVALVEKNPRAVTIDASSTRLGMTRLDKGSFLGMRVEKMIPSFKVLLIADKPQTENLVPWPIEVRRRLEEMLFCILATTNVHLSVRLILRECNESLVLAKRTMLGYGSLGNIGGDLDLLIYSGRPREDFRKV